MNDTPNLRAALTETRARRLEAHLQAAGHLAAAAELLAADERALLLAMAKQAPPEDS